MWKALGRGFDSRRLHSVISLVCSSEFIRCLEATKVAATNLRLFLIILFLLASTHLSAQGQVQVFEGSRKSQIAIQSIEGSDYVRVDDLKTYLNLATTSLGGNQNLSIVSDKHNVILSANRTLVSLDGKLVPLSRPVYVVQGTWFVPLDFIPKVLKQVTEKRILWLENNRSLILGDIQPNQLTLKYSIQPDRSQLVFQSVRPINYTTLNENGFIIIRPQTDDYMVAFEDTSYQDGIIKGVSIRASGDKKSFYVETGDDFASFQSFQLADPPRLVVDLYRKGSAPQPVIPAPVPAPTPPPPSGQQSVSPSLLPSVVPEKRVIVVDPGHGGSETGAKGPDGTFEKEITLGIARKLKAILESDPGVRAILTRNGDEQVGLDDRTALANNNKADLFVSIHANATLHGMGKGAETYYLSTSATDDETRNIAAVENNAIGLNQQVPNVNSDLKLILWDMAQTEYLVESSKLAEMIQQELNNALGISNRGIKQAPFRVLMGATMPAVLVEVGFINNPAEEKMMKDGEYQSKIARAIFDSIQKFQSSRVERSSQLQAKPD